VLAPALGENFFGSNKSVAQAADPLKFTPVRLPPSFTDLSTAAKFLGDRIRDKH